MTLWSHALAALLFALIALSQFRHAGSALPRLTFTLSLGVTALWALGVAGLGANDPAALLLEGMRDLGWLGFLFVLVRRDPRVPRSAVIVTLYAIVAAIMLVGATIAIIDAALPDMPGHALFTARVALGMMTGLGAMLLAHHVYASVERGARGGVWLITVALAVMWAADVLLYAAGYVEGSIMGVAVALRGVAIAAVAPLFALAVHRNGDWSLQFSRAVTYRSLTLGAVLLYVLAMVLGLGLIASWGGANARVIETAYVLGVTTALLAVISTPWARAWAKVKLAKHLFEHRYDYRQEWLGFTDTLGQPGEGAAPLETRIVKAVADLTDSPGGLLLVRAGAGFEPGAAWNWTGPREAAGAALVDHLEASARIIVLDAVRAGEAGREEILAIPGWLHGFAAAWVVVPLLHFGRLTGAILLARPPIDRAPDWEDFDMLRLASRQAASYLAEARAQSALAEAQRFEEFNRRFAFIMHDIKNLVSQLSLVARNAERHADNPDFRADMVATLKDSAARMNDLLARLSQHHQARPDEPSATPLGPLVERVAARRRAQHPIIVDGACDAVVTADPARLEQCLDHLLQNAIEASPAGAAVRVSVTRLGARAAIDVVDTGAGMSAAFVRDQLFKPFVSSKPGGFGLGAFEARQIAESMGGGVDVFSREGAGTRFRVTLAAQISPQVEAA